MLNLCRIMLMQLLSGNRGPNELVFWLSLTLVCYCKIFQCWSRLLLVHEVLKFLYHLVFRLFNWGMRTGQISSGDSFLESNCKSVCIYPEWISVELLFEIHQLLFFLKFFVLADGISLLIPYIVLEELDGLKIKVVYIPLRTFFISLF